MTKLLKLKSDLKELIDNSKAPILAWSGGKDSTFLLSILQELDYNVPVLVFPHFWSKHQLKFIKKIVSQYKMQSFFYRPTRMEYLNSTIYAFYTVGSKDLPVAFDVIPGDSCGLEIGKQAVKGVIPYFVWDRVIIGTKKSDKHNILSEFNFKDYENISTPLWNWSDGEILSATKLMGLPYDERVYDDKDETADTGNFVGCMRCLEAKGRVFCPKEKKEILGYG